MKKVIVPVVVIIIGLLGFKMCKNNESLTDVVKNSAETAMNTAKNAGDMAMDTAKNAGDMAMDTAKNAGDMAMDTAKNAGDMAMDTAKNAGDMAMDTAKNAGDMAMDTAKNAGDMAMDTAKNAGNMAENAMDKLGEFFSRELPGGISLNIPKLGVENKLIEFIENSQKPNTETWFDFDRISFETGSSTLSSESKEQITNISKILKAYPNLMLKIGGYTDSTGSDEVNRNVSQKRADAVKAQIVESGIDSGRLKTEGYGATNPIASNDTPEGRQQNRRISLRVLSK